MENRGANLAAQLFLTICRVSYNNEFKCDPSFPCAPNYNLRVLFDT